MSIELPRADGCGLKAAPSDTTSVLNTEPTGVILSAAADEAGQAAALARVQIVDVVGARDITEVVSVGEQVWGPRGTLERNQFRALVHAGSPVHLARDLDHTARPVLGFAVGFLGWSPILHVHSHQVGVVPGEHRRGIGYALKLAQRHTCLSQGVTDMRWTFDPLVRRNVAFNLRALGARATRFYVDFYGDMEDAINSGDASDRLEAVWSLAETLPTRPVNKPAEPPPGDRDPVLVLVERDGWPELTGEQLSDGSVLAVPSDYETLRRQDPACAHAWRCATREVLHAAYADGLRVGGVTDIGYQLMIGEVA